MKEPITYEQAKESAEKVRKYMNEGKSCRGPQWVWETFDLAYILQEWRRPDLFDRTQDRDEYTEEYNFIHNASTYNWHMYEDPEYD